LEPDLIVFSVKDIDVSSAKDPAVAWLRWRKKAIEQSAGQIYGAERWLDSATHVVRSDGSPGLALPLVSERRLHRVAERKWRKCVRRKCVSLNCAICFAL